MSERSDFVYFLYILFVLMLLFVMLLMMFALAGGSCRRTDEAFGVAADREHRSFERHAHRAARCLGGPSTATGCATARWRRMTPGCR